MSRSSLVKYGLRIAGIIFLLLIVTIGAIIAIVLAYWISVPKALELEEIDRQNDVVEKNSIVAEQNQLQATN